MSISLTIEWWHVLLAFFYLSNAVFVGMVAHFFGGDLYNGNPPLYQSILAGIFWPFVTIFMIGVWLGEKIL